MTPSDHELLEKFRTQDHQPSFAALVSRHLGLVHSAALRITGRAHLAEDVSQLVFMKLARTRSPLKAGSTLANWLYTAARTTAIDILRSEKRRRQREDIAISLSPAADSPFAWERVSPLIDEAMGKLSQDERQVILCRYFQGQSYGESARSLGLSEDAARMRANRAIGKIRGFLRQRGIHTTASALSAALPAQAVTAAPAGLAASISAAAPVAASTTVLSSITIATMTKKATIAVATTLLFASLGTGLYVANKKGASSQAEASAGAPENSSSVPDGKEGVAPPIRSRDRPADTTASAAEADLVARYGASRVKTARRLASKTVDLMGEDGLGSLVPTIGPQAAKENYTKLSESLSLSDDQKAKLKAQLDKMHQRDVQAYAELMNHLRTGIPISMESILIADAFKRGQVSKEEYEAAHARRNAEDQKLAPVVKNLKFATSITQLTSDAGFMNEFTSSLTPTQKDRLHELYPAEPSQDDDLDFASINGELTKFSEEGKSLEDAEKEMDEATEMMTGLKAMMLMASKAGEEGDNSDTEDSK